jgi:Uncharacterised protein domain (DUF2415)
VTVAELFALPVGARIHWQPPDWTPGGDYGTVTARHGAEVWITWNDGRECSLSPDEDVEDLLVVAEWAERVDVADVPVVIDRRA